MEWSLRSRLLNTWATLRPAVCVEPPPLILYRVKQDQPICYRSPLVQQLQAEPGSERCIDAILKAFTAHPDWQVQLSAQHRLEFIASPSSVQQFWQTVWQAGLPPLPPLRGRSTVPNTPAVLQIQYTHGRCRDLLAFATDSELLPVAMPDWSQLDTAGDRALQAAWLDCSDELQTLAVDKNRALKTLVQLSHAWHRWHRYHQIWGMPRPLAQARLALLQITAQLFGYGLCAGLQLEPWQSA